MKIDKITKEIENHLKNSDDFSLMNISKENLSYNMTASIFACKFIKSSHILSAAVADGIQKSDVSMVRYWIPFFKRMKDSDVRNILDNLSNNDPSKYDAILYWKKEKIRISI